MKSTSPTTTASPDNHRFWRPWCLYDWANSAFATVILSALFPVYFAALVPEGGLTIPGLGKPIPAASLWGYTVAGSLLVIALFAPHVGAWADRRGWQKRLFILLTCSGAICTLGLGLPFSATLGPAMLLFMAGNFSFAGANVFYNAYLPVLAKPEEFDLLSSRGFALGYIGGGVMLAIAFGLILGLPRSGLATIGEATRFGFLLTGIWWFSFALPAMRHLPAIAPQNVPARNYSAVFRELLRYPDLFRFLIAFLCFNDGVQTVIAVAAVFAKTELNLDQGSILGCFLLIQFLSWPGTLAFNRVTGKLGQKKALIIGISMFTGITVYAYFMHHAWQFWLLGICVALILGGCQAISRSLFAQFVPPARQSEFFGFYAISNKFASIGGPILFALVGHLTGSTRLATLALASLFIIGMLILAGVDVQRGRQAALAPPS
ncbi:MAG: MFS transporter [Desulfuromonas sp.]|nr:MAG: MFS transporter [Desulfuromonas sp.]